MNSPSHVRARRPARKPTLPPRFRWQEEALAETRAGFAHQDHRYAQAPMGTGKTRLMADVCEIPDIEGDRVIVIGMSDIVDQHRKKFKDEFGYLATGGDEEEADLVSPSGQRVDIMTWQRLGSLARSGVERQIGLLILDECHVGASGSDLDREGTLKRIFDVYRPTKNLYVSATLGAVNEQLLGSKAGHTYRLTLAQAYEDKLLNPLELIEVHAGTRAKILAIEAATGGNMEQLQEINCASTVELAGALKDQRVAIKSELFRVIQQRHDVMIELYMKHHPREQALFFSPRIEYADDAAGRFRAGPVQAPSRL